MVYEVKAQTFNDMATVRPNYIQVTDLRGSMAGWNVTVKQETMFENVITHTPLKGAILSFDKQWVNFGSASKDAKKPTVKKDAIKIDEIGASYPIATADKGTGAGTWVINFGSTGKVNHRENSLEPIETSSQENSKAVKGFTNSAIQLFVPGNTKKEPGKYKTVITWTISELT